jgi:hypothetical protein
VRLTADDFFDNDRFQMSVNYSDLCREVQVVPVLGEDGKDEEASIDYLLRLELYQTGY